jgi:hypothetical protein
MTQGWLMKSCSPMLLQAPWSLFFTSETEVIFFSCGLIWCNSLVQTKLDHSTVQAVSQIRT